MFKPSVRSTTGGLAAGWREKVQKMRAPREQRTKAANISIDGNGFPIGCTIRDISASGARISVPNSSSLPDQFLLLCVSEEMIARVQVAWRKDMEMGIRFLRKGGLHNEAEMLRAQSVAYQQFLQAQAEAAEREKQNQSQFVARAQAESMLENFRILGLNPALGYTPDQIRQTYRQKAMRAHPDHGGSVEEFQAITKAAKALELRFSAPGPASGQ